MPGQTITLPHPLPAGHIVAAGVPVDETYTTPRLPRFRLHVPTLWRDDLPDFFTIAQTVKDD